MKHKLLPTMIGAILAGGMGSAAADITVFGHIDTAIVNTDQDEGWRNTNRNPGNVFDIGESNIGWFTSSDAGESKIDDTNFKCTTCSIGFKGSEDLGNGLKAIFYLDFQYDIFSRDSTSLLDRDQWLGLAGNFGQVRWGTISTSYKSHGAMVDPMYRTAVQGRGVGLQSYLHNEANEDGGGRSEQTVRWDSPNWNGLKVTAHYTLDSDEFDGTNRDGTNPTLKEDDDPYGIGAQYSNGGILVFADYVTNDGDDATNPHGDMAAWKIGGKYTINNFAVMGQYESIEQEMFDAGAAGRQEGIWWHVGGTYTMGNNMVYLAYGQNEFEDMENHPGASTDLESEAITIAGVHKMSNRTSIYAFYNVQTQDADDRVNTSVSNGMSCDQDTGAGCKDVDKDSLGIGMKHKF